jgi:hypothetical protein
MEVTGLPETDEEADPLPDEVETALFVGYGEFNCGNPQEYEDFFREDMDLSERPKPQRPDEMASPTVTFESGEEVPVDLARDCWGDRMSDMFALLDSEQNRLDEHGGKNENPEAVKEWRIRNGHE